MSAPTISTPLVNTQGSDLVVAQPMQAPSRSSYWTVYTPVDAAMVLENENFARQRPVRPFHVKFLVGLMRSGEFQPSEIKFAVTPDDRRHLINGQHRLHAIVEAGLSQTLLCTMVPAHDNEHLAQLYSAEDRILGRTVFDTFNAFGLAEELNLGRTLAGRCGAAVNMILAGFNALVARGQRSDLKRALAIREWSPELKIWQSIVGTPNGPIGRMNNSAVIAVGIVTLRYQREIAEPFWRTVRANDGLHRGTPERTLVDHITVTMMSGGGSEKLYVKARYIANCWNAHFEGRPLQRARPSDTAKPIRIAGTPYDGKTIVLPSNESGVPF